MHGDADIASVAALMGEPVRAAVLLALTDGRALAASTLAAEAGVAPSTISTHLSRLVDGGLIRVEPLGRHRYYRLANYQVAEAVEALARLAPIRTVRSLRQGTHAEAIRRARTCYDHLAGRLGVALCDSLVTSGVIQFEDIANAEHDPVLGIGRARRCVVTAAGQRRLDSLGVELASQSRRPLASYCVDWSEQQAHIGGRLGAGLFNRLLALEWLTRADRRVIRVTNTGRVGLATEFAIDSDAMY
jgi:DNA-binding transcriptional ArsR family regulator